METLWSDFINSKWRDWRGSERSEDRMNQEKWQNYYLQQWRLKAPVPADEETVSEMREFRDRLHEMSIRLSEGAAVSDDDLGFLNTMLHTGPVRRQLDTEGDKMTIGLVPLREDWDQVMAEVAADFAHTLVNGEAGRIRICENPDCRWVFYDDTRNRTKKYCEDKTCGNLMKVRRFRAKRKKEQEEQEHGQED